MDIVYIVHDIMLKCQVLFFVLLNGGIVFAYSNHKLYPTLPLSDDHYNKRIKLIKKEKYARLLKDEINSILSSDRHLSTLGGGHRLEASVSTLQLSPDMSFAKVYIAVFGNAVNKRKNYVHLSQRIRYVQHLLNCRLKFFKKVPKIQFKLSNSLDIASKFAEISIALKKMEESSTIFN